LVAQRKIATQRSVLYCPNAAQPKNHCPAVKINISPYIARSRRMFHPLAWRLLRMSTAVIIVKFIPVLMLALLGMSLSVAPAFSAQTQDSAPTPASTADHLAQRANRLFAKENLVAWCIVPFDAKKRGPKARTQMLQKLGLQRCAYDWREEHVATFEQEILEYQNGGIDFFAFWELHDHALDLFQKYNLKPQIWKMMPDPGAATPQMTQANRVIAAAEALTPIAQRAKNLGCKLSLYNHGGWAGQPENLAAVCQALTDIGFDNVGIVYNFHHAHDRIADFQQAFNAVKPFLHCLNLNGMNDHAEPKIVGIGKGQHEREMIKVVLNSDYHGPIGILDHRDELDSELALQENLDGLALIVEELKAEAKEASGQVSHYDPQVAEELAAQAQRSGNAARGVQVFASAKFACLSCHKVGQHGGVVGPALTNLGKEQTGPQIASSVLWPKHEVKPEYTLWQILTVDGQVYRGYRSDISETEIALRDVASDKSLTLALDDIEQQQPAGTPMPDGIAETMTPLQKRDLLKFLTGLGHQGPKFQEELQFAYANSHSHGPIEFPINLSPLVAENWPNSTKHVNRDRVYDFYTKQALYFRDQPSVPLLLNAFQSLDGPNTGHWGNQNEQVWADGRWNDTQLGSVQSGVIRVNNKTIARGICVQLGDQGQLSACFDPDTLTYPAVWGGGFVGFSSVRHGFMDGLQLQGQVLQTDIGSQPSKSFKYLGFYRDGPKVAFKYQIADTVYLDSPGQEDGKFIRTVAPIDSHPMRSIVAGGTGRSPEILKTKISYGSGSSYAVDTIQLPIDNQWKALIFCSGLDFFSDGSALVCTMQGDVWHVSGFAGTKTVATGSKAATADFSVSATGRNLETATWRRFATGLHQPLGLVIDQDKVFVQCRDQLLCLEDLNEDGEADFYQCYSNAFITSASGHDYICGLQRDSAGNFYTASGNQGLLKISADGSTATVLATGFRNPDGIGIMPDRTITVPCSEGDWTPASMICAVSGDDPRGSNVAKPESSNPRRDRLPHYGYRGPIDEQPPELPWVYLPRGLDNSSGGQVWVDSDHWGAMTNQMIHLSFGAGSHFLILDDEVQGQRQGAVVPLVGDFDSGVHRGRFNPQDGQLYVGGMTGWGSYTPDLGCFQRIRFTGQTKQSPVGFHVHENGILLKFSQPLDRNLVQNSKQHFAQCWNYKYSQGYGSPEMSPSHDNTVGHDTVAITSTYVLEDGKSMFLEMPDFQPVNQLHLHLDVAQNLTQEPSDATRNFGTDIFVTVHKMDEPFTEFPNYVRQQKIVGVHPMLRDLANAKNRIPNPFTNPIAEATEIQVTTGQNLTYLNPRISAKAGQPIKLILNNADVVPHNWALLRPDCLEKVGELSNRLIADPEAGLKQYIPQTNDVICYTDVVPGGDSFTIFFNAPLQPGRYPFLCTFPGHWMVMNGELLVE